MSDNSGAEADAFRIEDVGRDKIMAALMLAMRSNSPLRDQVETLVMGPLMQGRPDEQRIEQITEQFGPLLEAVWREFGPAVT
jgi:hypothetical protein